MPTKNKTNASQRIANFGYTLLHSTFKSFRTLKS